MSGGDQEKVSPIQAKATLWLYSAEGPLRSNEQLKQVFAMPGRFQPGAATYGSPVDIQNRNHTTTRNTRYGIVPIARARGVDRAPLDLREPQRCQNANDRSRSDYPERLTHHEANDGALMSTECDANTDLPRPLSDGVGDHAVDADTGQRQCESANTPRSMAGYRCGDSAPSMTSSIEETSATARGAHDERHLRAFGTLGERMYSIGFRSGSSCR